MTAPLFHAPARVAGRDFTTAGLNRASASAAADGAGRKGGDGGGGTRHWAAPATTPTACRGAGGGAAGEGDNLDQVQKGDALCHEGGAPRHSPLVPPHSDMSFVTTSCRRKICGV